MIRFPYARFLKCDLHVHTPLDAHWRDEASRLRPGDGDGRREEVCREFLVACHREELDVIGITDHNFAKDASSSLLPVLWQLNEDVAQACDRDPLVIFPGFEVEADVGHGCHVLCLLPPGTSPAVIDARVTALGLPPDRRFKESQPRPSRNNLRRVLEVIQDDENSPGLVIAAHPADEKGLFDDDRISEWLQVAEFTNPDLLCLEVPKPLSGLSRGWQRLIGGGKDCHPRWKRRRPIAYVRSSDAYRLGENPGSKGNHIGYRHTWIKMSTPSIESLRQAMLDRDSRIRVQDHRPEEGYRHPRVTAVRVRGTEFLRQDLHLHLSPNLTCLIGSRGTGKSSLIDYLREALDQLRDGDLPDDLREEIVHRIEDTFSPGAVLEVDIRTKGGEYRVVLSNEAGHRSRKVYARGDSNPIEDVDLRALFPCRFLSQREIDYSVAKRTDKSALRKLLDDFLLDELDHLARGVADRRGAIRELDERLKARRETLTRRNRLSTRLRDLRGRLEKVEPLRDIMPAWRRVSREADYFHELAEGVRGIDQETADLHSRLDEILPTPPEDLLEGENGDLIRRAHDAVRAPMTEFAARLSNSRRDLAEATTEFSSEFAKIREKEWRQRVASVQVAFEQAKRVAEERGVDFEEIERLPELIRDTEEELDRLESVGRELDTLESERAGLLSELRAVWSKETALRREKANELMTRLTPDGADRKPLVKIVVEHQAAQEATVQLLLDRVPDKRRVNREDIVGVVAKAAAVAAEPGGTSGLLPIVIDEVREGTESKLLSAALGQRLEAFLQALPEPTLRELEVARVPDRVQLFVHRDDGTLAGPIDRVSAGQQGTAILNILLASGEEPLFIDTPEEGLDNEGVYRELVPLFRREKERRQVGVVTHNANIPVNGDAEAIIALEAVGYVSESAIREVAERTSLELSSDPLTKVAQLMPSPDWEERVRSFARDSLGASEEKAEVFITELGGIRRAEGRVKAYQKEGALHRCVGGLDNGRVKRAVQDVMEGSQEAFERRREMYGF